MPDFSPFRGIRYDPNGPGADLDAVTAPPYDVIDADQRVALERSAEHNAVQLILPRGGADAYTRAAGLCSRWLESGVLRVDGEPQFYGYRMRRKGPAGHTMSTLGVVGALALPPDGPGSGDVLLHERTMPKTKGDRLSLLRETRANLDPIWGLSLAKGLTQLIPTHDVLGSCQDQEGVEHTLFAITDSIARAQIAAAIGRSAVVLADGHHRFETACTYRDELVAGGTEAGTSGAIMTLMVELVDDQLTIEAIHRAIQLPGTGIRDRLADVFETTPLPATEITSEPDPTSSAIVLVDRDGIASLTPRSHTLDERSEEWPTTVRDIDAAVVERLIVPRLEGAAWEYRHDAAATAALVGKGEADAALILRPVSVGQTRAAALAGDRMPQKTTFFAPKPRTGLVFRSLDV